MKFYLIQLSIIACIDPHKYFAADSESHLKVDAKVKV